MTHPVCLHEKFPSVHIARDISVIVLTLTPCFLKGLVSSIVSRALACAVPSLVGRTVSRTVSRTLDGANTGKDFFAGTACLAGFVVCTCAVESATA